MSWWKAYLKRPAESGFSILPSVDLGVCSQPAPMNAFRVDFNEQPILSQSVLDIEIDLVSKFLILHIIDSADGTVSTAIEAFIGNEDKALTWSLVNRAGTISRARTFRDLTVTSHYYRNDYTKDDAAVHTVTMEYATDDKLLGTLELTPTMQLQA